MESSTLVNKVCVTEGAKVTKGQTIVVLEAMKAYFNVHASESGVLTKLMVSEGTMVELGGSIAMIKVTNESAIKQSGGTNISDEKLSSSIHSMQIESLHEAYKNGTVSPSDIVEQIFSQIHADGGSKKGNVWIELGDERKVSPLFLMSPQTHIYPRLGS